MEEGLGAEVSLVPEFGGDHGTTARPIETFEHGVVEAFEWDRPDAGVPNDFGDESHDGHDDVGVHRHLKRPSDAVLVQREVVPAGFLIEGGVGILEVFVMGGST